MAPAGLTRTLAWVRDARWFDARRGAAYLAVFAAVGVAAVLSLFLTTRDGIDVFGRPIGTDFISFWTAARLPADRLYSIEAHFAAQKALFPVQAYTAYFYPPVFALYTKPLALLPYLPALLGFLAVTGSAYWAALARWLPRRALTFAVAFPPFLLTVGHGQTSFLSAALIGAGVYLLACRPIASGTVFGLLVFKPQLGLLIPLYLVAARQWRALAAAALCVAALAAVTTVAFGPAIWSEWWATTGLARRVMEDGTVGFAKMQSVFAAARLLGGTIPAAYGLQAAGAIAAAGLTAWCAWRVPDRLAAGAVMIAATLLTTPFLLDYDLTLMAFPLAWLLTRGGAWPWERPIIGLGFVYPLVGRGIAQTWGLPLGPIVFALVLCAVARRALWDCQGSGRSVWARSRARSSAG